MFMRSPWVEFHLAVKDEAIECPHCQGREYWRRGKRQRRINTLPIGPKQVVLVVEVPKCECRNCGKCFEHPPFAPAYSQHSRALARFVCELSRFMSLQDVARFTHLGCDTVKSIVKADLARRYESVEMSEVRRIGVDEPERSGDSPPLYSNKRGQNYLDKRPSM